MFRKICFLSCLFVQTAWGDAAQNLVQASQQFSFDLMRQLDEKNSNLCFSPYSLSSALAMTFDGARGQTQREMERVLGFSSSAADVNAAFSELNKGLAATDIHLANSLWIQKNLTVLPNFLEDMKAYYRAGLYFVDFQTQTESARVNINNWANQATQGKVANLLAPGSITEATRMVLASAIYLKARWMTPFSEKQTIKHPFFGLDDTTFSVPMMVNTGTYSYYEDPLAQMVELPYSDGKLAMLCLLPQESASLRQLEEGLNAQLFNRWRAALKSEQINLFLPKFKMSASLNLGETLSRMGMASAFNENADFSGINGSKDLQISQIFHKAFIASDEAGTEAAAATAVVIALKSSLQEVPPRVLKLDRPFLFMIYEKDTGAILFLGRVANPLE